MTRFAYDTRRVRAWILCGHPIESLADSSAQRLAAKWGMK